MSRSIAPVAVLVLLAASAASAEDWAQKMFKVATHDFGNVARDSKAEFEFTLENPYLEDVHIASVRSSCGCTTPRIKDGKDTLKSWETTAIVAHINTDKFLGKKGATLTVTFDRPYYAQAQLHVRTYIRDDIILNPGAVEFGTVDQGQALLQSVAVGANSRQGWRILEVKSDNPHLSGKVVEARRDWNQTVYHLTVRLEGDAPTGYLSDHVMLVTNDPARSQIPVAVEARIVPGISVGPRMLSMGVVQPGQKVSKKVVVKGKQPFRITGIKAEGEGFEIDSPAGQEPKQFYVIPVSFTAGEKPGTVVETIHIETDMGDAVAEFSAQAVVAGEVAAEEPVAVAGQESPDEWSTQRADASGTMPAATATPVEPAEPAPSEPAAGSRTVATRGMVPLPEGMPMPPFVVRRLGVAVGPPPAQSGALPAESSNPRPIGRPLRGRFGFFPGR